MSVPSTHHARTPELSAVGRATHALAGRGDQVIIDGQIVITAGMPTHERLLRCLRRRQAGADGLRRRVALPPRQLQPRGRRAVRAAVSEPDDQHALQPVHAAAHARLASGTRSAAKAGSTTTALRAMQEVGCVYLSFLGGGCTLFAEAIRGVVDVHWRDLIPQFRLVASARVGADRQCCDRCKRQQRLCQSAQRAEARLPAILAELDAGRIARGAS